MLDSQTPRRPHTRTQATRLPVRSRRTSTEPSSRASAAAVPASHAGLRPLCLLIIMGLCASGIAARLTFWSVLEHGHLAAAASAQQHAALDVQPPVRGQIVDSGGNLLATDVAMDQVYGIPREVKDPARTAQLLAPIVQRPERYLQQILTGDSGYALISPAVPRSVSRRVRDLALPGIALYPVIHRTYPDGSMASQVLGFTDQNGVGQYGLEGSYNALLSGRAGLQSVVTDTAGNEVRVSASAPVPSHDGATLHLSLDPMVQDLIENELSKAIKKHNADGGTIIVMDPHTGFVLGMASSPAYDPNHYQVAAASDPSRLLNPAIQWGYEPGSTFKILTMAAGLDTHLITPDTTFYDSGQFAVDQHTVIHNWNMSGWGLETMTQVLQHSANVGASWVASRLGVDRFYRYMHRFRLGRPTDIDLQGEESGILPLPGQHAWTIANLYTNSFGQGLLVTPMQMIRAVAAVANGGVMMKPQMVKRIVYDGRVIDRRPVRVARVISPQTARTITSMLVRSAVGGEASAGLVHGYNIAAKTGTANIAGPNGVYIPGATIASIVGYAPANHPRFVALIIIRHPRDTIWGSMAAAPVLHDLFQELFLRYHIPPSPHASY